MEAGSRTDTPTTSVQHSGVVSQNSLLDAIMGRGYVPANVLPLQKANLQYCHVTVLQVRTIVHVGQDTRGKTVARTSTNARGHLAWRVEPA